MCINPPLLLTDEDDTEEKVMLEDEEEERKKELLFCCLSHLARVSHICHHCFMILRQRSLVDLGNTKYSLRKVKLLSNTQVSVKSRLDAH